MVTQGPLGPAFVEPSDEYLEGWRAYYTGQPYDMRRSREWRAGWLAGKESRSGEVSSLGGHS